MENVAEQEERMKESALERQFCKLVTRAGGKAYKFISPGNSGVPDRIVVLPGGRIGFVELKQTGEMPRKQQEFKQQELRQLGCYTAVVDSRGCAEAVVAELQRQKPAVHVCDPLFKETTNRRPGRKAGMQL